MCSRPVSPMVVSEQTPPLSRVQGQQHPQFHACPRAARPAPLPASRRWLLLQPAGGRCASRRQAGSAAGPLCSPRPAPPHRRVYIRRCFRPAAAAAPSASSPGSARPGPAPCGCPPLSASMRRRRPAACPGHGHQRPVHQLQEGRREPRAVSRGGGGQFPASPRIEPLPLTALTAAGKRGRAWRGQLVVFPRSAARASPAARPAGSGSLGSLWGRRRARRCPGCERESLLLYK